MSPDKSSAESSNFPVVITDGLSAARIRAAKGMALFDAGMTAAQVAAKMGVSQQRVHQWKHERMKRQGKDRKGRKVVAVAPERGVPLHHYRIAQKTQRGAIAAMQTEGATDFLIDVILLTKAVMQE